MLTGRLRLDSAFLDVVVLRETLLVLSLSRSKTWLKGRLEAREDDGVLDRERRVGGSVAAGTEIELRSVVSGSAAGGPASSVEKPARD